MDAHGEITLYSVSLTLTLRHLTRHFFLCSTIYVSFLYINFSFRLYREDHITLIAYRLISQ